MLGVAYKKDVADCRESSSSELIHLLRGWGARVSYNDPYVPAIPHDPEALVSMELTDECLSAADCVVIATAHSCYDMRKIAALSKLVFDARGVTRHLRGDNIIRLGE